MPSNSYRCWWYGLLSPAIVFGCAPSRASACRIPVVEGQGAVRNLTQPIAMRLLLTMIPWNSNCLSAVAENGWDSSAGDLCRAFINQARSR